MVDPGLIGNTLKLRIVTAIPCYNTRPHITEVVTKTLQYVDEVIVVDDGDKR